MESNRTEFVPCGPKCHVQSLDRMREQTTRTVPQTDRYPSVCGEQILYFCVLETVWVLTSFSTFFLQSLYGKFNSLVIPHSEPISKAIKKGLVTWPLGFSYLLSFQAN